MYLGILLNSMLTFEPGDDHVEISQIRQGENKKLTPVYWSPVIRDDMRNSIDDLGYYFNNNGFRDRFELSNQQASAIQEAMEQNCVCEKYQQKHFKCKRFIQESLDREMDLSGTDQEFTFKLPPGGDTYGFSHFCCGNSGAGKTHFCSRLCQTNMDGPKKDRRHFLYISNEYNIDKTLAPLKADRYRDLFTGVDISEGTIRDSQYDPQAFFDNEIQLRVDTAPRGTMCIVDDAPDAHPIVADNIRRLITKLQRVGRHTGVGLIFLLHKLSSGLWSTQAYSSCKNIIVFPRSMKNKIRDLMEKEIGITRREAKRHLHDFSQTGRACVIRMHSPALLQNEKLIRLL
jgi:hypothetical protein